MTTTKNETEELQRYALFGRAAMIPGVQAAIDTLQEFLDTMRQELAAAQGHPAKTVQKQTAARAAALKKKTEPGFTKMSGKPSKLHPRDPSHPGHAKWVAALQKGKKKARRLRKKTPVVNMEKAA